MVFSLQNVKVGRPQFGSLDVPPARHFQKLKVCVARLPVRRAFARLRQLLRGKRFNNRLQTMAFEVSQPCEKGRTTCIAAIDLNLLADPRPHDVLHQRGRNRREPHWLDMRVNARECPEPLNQSHHVSSPP